MNSNQQQEFQRELIESVLQHQDEQVNLLAEEIRDQEVLSLEDIESLAEVIIKTLSVLQAEQVRKPESSPNDPQ